SVKTTSRYRTAAPASQSPTPRPATRASRTKSGRKTTCQFGQVPNHAKRPIEIVIARARSTSGATTADSGANKRGKYTLPRIPTLFATLEVAPVRAETKYVHTNMPAKRKRGYATPD